MKREDKALKEWRASLETPEGAADLLNVKGTVANEEHLELVRRQHHEVWKFKTDLARAGRAHEFKSSKPAACLVHVRCARLLTLSGVERSASKALERKG